MVAIGVAALIAPWSFHIGGRWTPFTTWEGVGRLIDSTGRPYGLYVSFNPEFYRGRRGGSYVGGPARPAPHSILRGRATVCTQSGLKIPLKLSGDVYGAWSDVEGKEIDLGLTEPANIKPRRHFSLYGSFHGAALSMDDHKSMFMYLLSDGNLTPARSYTSPVPEKHAKVALEWGNEADFDRLCHELPR